MLILPFKSSAKKHFFNTFRLLLNILATLPIYKNVGAYILIFNVFKHFPSE